MYNTNALRLHTKILSNLYGTTANKRQQQLYAETSAIWLHRVGLHRPDTRHINSAAYAHHAYVTYVIAAALVQLLYVMKLVVVDVFDCLPLSCMSSIARTSLRHKPTTLCCVLYCDVHVECHKYE
jgi:hypothetical protein